MKYFLRISASLIVAFLFTSCEKVIDFDEEEAEPVLTISSFISDVDYTYLSIGNSVSVLSSELPGFISEASATLYKGQEYIGPFELTNSEFGKFTFPTILESTGDYEVRVSSGSYESISAVTKIPSKPQNVSVEVFDENSSGATKMRLTFSDDPNSDDYYHLFVGFSFDQGTTFSQTDFQSNSEFLIEENFGFSFGDDSNYYYDRAIFSDQLFQDELVSIDFEVFVGEGVPLYLQLVKSSEDYYNYFKSIYAYENSGGPFSQPVQVFDNVSNGLGVFAGYSYELVEIEF